MAAQRMGWDGKWGKNRLAGPHPAALRAPGWGLYPSDIQHHLAQLLTALQLTHWTQRAASKLSPVAVTRTLPTSLPTVTQIWSPVDASGPQLEAKGPGLCALEHRASCWSFLHPGVPALEVEETALPSLPWLPSSSPAPLCHPW